MANKRKFDYDKVSEYYSLGYSQAETAKKFNTNLSQIKHILLTQKIKIRPTDKSGEKNPNWKGGEVDDGYETAAHFGCGTTTVYNILEKRGVERKGHRWSKAKAGVVV